MKKLHSLEAIKAIHHHRGNAVVVSSLVPLRLWNAISESPHLDLPVHDCPDKASSLALGLALARPDLRVMVLEGDRSLLTNLGSLVTIAEQAPANLVHFVLQDGEYTLAGHEPLPGAGRVSYASLARAAGYSATYECDDLEGLVLGLEEIVQTPGPVFACLKVEHPTQLPPLPGRTLSQAAKDLPLVLRQG